MSLETECKGVRCIDLQTTMYSNPKDDDSLRALIHSVIKEDDLLSETLLLMSITSLKELKFVSKRWHSHITNPSFAAARSKKIERATSLFLENYMLTTNFVSVNQETETAKSFPKRLKLDDYQIRIFNSCNGLLCCYGLQARSNPDIPLVYICNPTTNRFSTIPELSYQVVKRSWIYSMCLAFDPTRSTSYKVICLYITGIEYEPATQAFEIGVYSSENNLWNHAVGPFEICMPYRNGVYWNGAIFWIADEDDSFYFKIEEKERHILVMPTILEYEAERKILYFGESRGHLNLAYTNGGPMTQFTIHEMVEDFSGWLAKYSVDIEAVMDAFPGSVRNWEPPDSPYRYR